MELRLQELPRGEGRHIPWQAAHANADCAQDVYKRQVGKLLQFDIGAGQFLVPSSQFQRLPGESLFHQLALGDVRSNGDVLARFAFRA